MTSLTPEDLAALYGDGWRFDERDGIWIAVDRHGTRYEADDDLRLVGKIARRESISFALVEVG